MAAHLAGESNRTVRSCRDGSLCRLAVVAVAGEHTEQMTANLVPDSAAGRNGRLRRWSAPMAGWALVMCPAPWRGSQLLLPGLCSEDDNGPCRRVEMISTSHTGDAQGDEYLPALKDEICTAPRAIAEHWAIAKRC